MIYNTFAIPATADRYLAVSDKQELLEIIKNALEAVRLEPAHGELLYMLLYLTYFSEPKPKNRDAILSQLDRMGYPMSVSSYHNNLNTKASTLLRKTLQQATC